MPYQAAQGIARKVAAAISFLHGRGIAHGDVKTANVLVALEVDPDGNVYLLPKICDFGCSNLPGWVPWPQTLTCHMRDVRRRCLSVSMRRVRVKLTVSWKDVFAIWFALAYLSCFCVPPPPGRRFPQCTSPSALHDCRVDPGAYEGAGHGGSPATSRWWL
jgi:serine/threonine protein kinase